MLIERLGRFSRVAASGLNIIVPFFDRIRYRRHDASVFLYAGSIMPGNVDGKDVTRDQTLSFIVANIEPGSPAERAGLVAGDIILALDGAAITGADDLVRMLTGDKIGRAVEVEALHNRSDALSHTFEALRKRATNTTPKALRLAAYANGATAAEMEKVIVRIWRLHDEANVRDFLNAN